jgi:CxxC-x17-CxxC domain-containing protein
MKKARAKKEKISKKSAKAAPLEQQGLLDLVTVMAKVAERLEGMENKLEQVIRQNSAISAAMAHTGQYVQRVEPSHNGHEHKSEHPHSNQNHSQQNHNRHDRVMYNAICADCRRECEVPFKPTGERPVFCKECWAKRKADRQGKTTVEISTEPVPVLMTNAVSNKAAVSASASASSKTKSKKPAKKSKR